MEFHLVESMDEVLRLALDGPISPFTKAKGKFKGATPEPPAEPEPLAH